MLVRLYQRWLQTQGFRPNLKMRSASEPKWALDKDRRAHLGYFCMWLAELMPMKEIDALDYEEWYELFDHIGIDPGDGADVTSATLSKIPA